MRAMTATLSRGARIAAACALALGTSACDQFLTVDNPDVIAASEIDPTKDAATFSLSARQDLAEAVSNVSVFGSWLTWETWPAETFPEAIDFGRRAVPDHSVNLSNLWGRVARAATSGDRVVTILANTQGAGSNIDLARGYFVSGYALELMAETFCDGVITGGPKLTTAQLLDSAIVRFTHAIEIGKAAQATPSAATEAAQIVGASYVGRARAQLQAGRKAEAAADAALVPAGFRYDLLYGDVLSARARLANQAYVNTATRAQIVVPPSFRTNDPRVPFTTPNAGQLAVDGITPFYAQAKFKNFDSPIRLASKLEADYIAAEAGSVDEQLALINARRAANGQPAYAGATDAASVLSELMLQRSFEFYLEAKRLGDFRRNGAAVPFVPAPGTPFFKPGSSAVGDQTCLPIPFTETSTNPNFPH
jgi:hypothetical protein